MGDRNRILGHLFRWLIQPTGQSDSELLDRYTRQHDEDAFASLVHRHGPLVHGLCRRLLGPGVDADDAFQAIFLVLARKAGSIRKREALASWLYGVAYRTAREVGTRRQRRRSREGPAGEEPLTDSTPGPDAEAERRELQAMIAEELTQLPEKFRSAILLCDLQGQTQEEAARQLGCPKGTILSRLSRGRDRLRERLTRRGVMLSAPAVLAALGESVVAAVPRSLANAAGQVAQHSARSPAIAALADAVLRTLPGARNVSMASVLLFAMGAVAIAAAPVAVYFAAEPNGPEKPGYPDDYSMPTAEAFAEEFDGDALDPTKWLIAHKQWGGDKVNGGVVAENVSVANGVLRLEAHGDRYTGPVMGVRSGGGLRVDGRRVGAAVATRRYFASGRYEARIKICPHLGACSAIWTLHYEEYYPGNPRYQKKPVGGDRYYAINHEIDIELPGRPTAAKKDMSFRYALCNTFVGENEDESTAGHTDLQAAQDDGKFHTYRFDWHTGSDTEKKRVEFYVDDKRVRSIETHVPDLASRLWLGVWFPREWAGAPDFDTGRMEVDWVRITPFREPGDRFAPETFADDGWAKPATQRK
jgi:RNA polymerase sigma factor (sigma-70 family)